MDLRPFQPRPAGTIVIANATSATAAQPLDEGCQQVVLYNSSATAITFVVITKLQQAGDTPIVPTTSNGFPVPPGNILRITCDYGRKSIRTIASAADGNLYVSVGNGG